jgi:hypothetical protein
MWRTDLERGLIIGTGFMIINLFIGFLATLVYATLMTGSVSGGAAFLEIGFFLILGGCMMSRQPLKDEDRYDKEGNPTSTWRIALIGRQLLFASLFLFIYAALIAIISFYIPI